MHFIVSYEVIIADITHSVKLFNFCKAHMRFDPVGNNKKNVLSSNFILIHDVPLVHVRLIG